MVTPTLLPLESQVVFRLILLCFQLNIQTFYVLPGVISKIETFEMDSNNFQMLP